MLDLNVGCKELLLLERDLSTGCKELLERVVSTKELERVLSTKELRCI